MKAEILTVCVPDKGGVMFAETIPYLNNHRFFCEVLRRSRYRPKSKPIPPPEYKITSGNGWLSPDGKYYRCPWHGHIEMAQKFGCLEGNLEKKGWVKISKGELLIIKDVTQCQRDLIFDWCLIHTKKIPHWVT